MIDLNRDREARACLPLNRLHPGYRPPHDRTDFIDSVEEDDCGGPGPAPKFKLQSCEPLREVVRELSKVENAYIIDARLG